MIAINRRLRLIGYAAVFGAALVCAGAEPSFTTHGKDQRPQARVVIVEDNQATDKFEPRPDRVQMMVQRGITNLTGKATEKEAWLSLVTPKDVVGIKVFSEPGPNSGTRPAVAAAVARSLIAAGVPATNVIIWDKSATDLRLAGYYELAEQLGIGVMSSTRAGYDPTNFYDTPLLGNLIWGDLEFGQKGPGVGRKSFVSQLVSRAVTKIINLTPLLNHNLAGVTGNLYGLAMGSVDNTMRFVNDSDRLAKAVPEIYALPSLSDHVVLNIVDALICQYEGDQRSLLHYSTVMNQLRFSRDPVALDVLSIKELDRQRRQSDSPEEKPNLQLYENAGLLELGVADPTRIQVDILR